MNDILRFNLNGKVALISDAMDATGRECAAALSRAGATVVCAGKNLNRAEWVAEEIEALGGKADFVWLDVSRTSEIPETLREVIAKHGRLDILINNAEADTPRPFLDLTEDEYDAGMAINLKGAFFTAQNAARTMIAQGGGRIVNIVAGALAPSALRSVGKAGIIQLTQTMAAELSDKNVQVNALDFQPTGGSGTAQTLAECLALLAGDSSNTLNGRVFQVQSTIKPQTALLASD